MNRARVLYHLARADFLERVRRYSFLLILGFAVYLGWAAYSGEIYLRLGKYRGVYNSAWLGCLMALVGSGFLTLVGFYIVKNTIQRDEQTHVGQVLATTPISKRFYPVGKVISNLAVLSTMVLVLALAAVVMQLVQTESRQIELWALLSPILLFTLPAVAFTAALAVLFESLPGLRGGLGNVAYLFLWGVLLVGAGPAAMKSDGRQPIFYFTDLSGLVSVMGQMQAAVRQVDPDYRGGISMTLAIGQEPPSKRFVWTGVEWTSLLVLSRLTWMLLALGVAVITSVFFGRFDPARERWAGPKPKTPAAADPITHAPELISTSGHLTPMARTHSRTMFFRLVVAELRLMLNGQGWWWYAGAAGLFIACLASPLAASRGAVIIAAWLWPLLLWSPMGARETRHATQSLIFSAESSLHRQLPSAWIAGVLIASLTGGGLGLRLLISGDVDGLAAWAAAVLFIPTLALALGVWSGTSKAFETVYTAWWYIGPTHHIPGLDFMGTTPASSTPLMYLLLTGALLLASYLGRRVRMAYA